MLDATLALWGFHLVIPCHSAGFLEFVIVSIEFFHKYVLEMVYASLAAALCIVFDRTDDDNARVCKSCIAQFYHSAHIMRCPCKCLFGVWPAVILLYHVAKALDLQETYRCQEVGSTFVVGFWQDEPKNAATSCMPLQKP